MNNSLMNRSESQSIGNIISTVKNLTDEQIEKVIAHQRQHGTKFGESAVALGFANTSDVLWALSQQFHYPYAPSGASNVNAELVTANQPFEASAEFFRDLRSKLIENGVFSNGKKRALAVCSLDRGDGKTYMAANLAVVLSQLGGRTLLIDADMRAPRLDELLGVTRTASGLSGVLAGREEANVIRPVDALPSLFLLPIGVVPPNPLELIQGRNFDLLLAEVLAKFDYVVVDTPASTYGADARVIAAKCGAAFLVARKGVTRSVELEKFAGQLSKTCDCFQGTVLNEY
jgi:chain length determinant protein tyrosine kinase EpsG